MKRLFTFLTALLISSSMCIPSFAIKTHSDTLDVYLEKDGLKDTFIVCGGNLEDEHDLKYSPAPFNLMYITETASKFRDFPLNPQKIIGYYSTELINIDKSHKKNLFFFTYGKDGGFYTEVVYFNDWNFKSLGYIDGHAYALADMTIPVNKKQNIFYFPRMTKYPLPCIYYQTYKVVNGNLSRIDTNEKNIYFYKYNPKTGFSTASPCSAILTKNLNVYNSKLNRKIFTIYKNEKATLVSANSKNGYIKIKNSRGQVGYIPTIYRQNSVTNSHYFVKQYPNTDIYKLFSIETYLS